MNHRTKVTTPPASNHCHPPVGSGPVFLAGIRETNRVPKIMGTNGPSPAPRARRIPRVVPTGLATLLPSTRMVAAAAPINTRRRASAVRCDGSPEGTSIASAAPERLTMRIRPPVARSATRIRKNVVAGSGRRTVIQSPKPAKGSIIIFVVTSMPFTAKKNHAKSCKGLWRKTHHPSAQNKILTTDPEAPNTINPAGDRDVKSPCTSVAVIKVGAPPAIQPVSTCADSWHIIASPTANTDAAQMVVILKRSMCLSLLRGRRRPDLAVSPR
jgi:hypothetical protein